MLILLLADKRKEAKAQSQQYIKICADMHLLVFIFCINPSDLEMSPDAFQKHVSIYNSWY
jgi:hypothetical protein